MLGPGKPFIKGHPKITGVVNPLDWLPEELYCSGFRDAPTGVGEEHRGALRGTDGDRPLTQPLLLRGKGRRQSYLYWYTMCSACAERGGGVTKFQTNSSNCCRDTAETVHGSPREVPLIFDRSQTEFTMSLADAQIVRGMKFQENFFSTEAKIQPKNYIVLKEVTFNLCPIATTQRACSACADNWRYKVSGKIPKCKPRHSQKKILIFQVPLFIE